MARNRPIKVDKRYVHNPTGKLAIGGWLMGERTYLWIGAAGKDGPCLGFVQGKGPD